jgi:hypothetical protein
MFSLGYRCCRDAFGVKRSNVKEAGRLRLPFGVESVVTAWSFLLSGVVTGQGGDLRFQSLAPCRPLCRYGVSLRP